MRLYTDKGGIVLFRLSIDDLVTRVNHETQFIGKNTEAVNLNMIAGPDERDYVVSHFKQVHLDLPVETETNVTDGEIIITLKADGQTLWTYVKIAKEHLKRIYTNYALGGWYAKLGAPQHELYHGYAANAQRELRAVVLRYFVHSASLAPLKDRYLGILDSVPDSASLGDVCYATGQLMVYYPLHGELADAWQSVNDVVDSLGEEKKVTEIPDATTGSVFLVIGKINTGGYTLHPGDVMICISHNTDDFYTDTIENFMIIGK